MSVQSMVDNPMWFSKEVPTEEFVKGYCQAVYQIRLKLTSMGEKEPLEIRQYTNFMMEEFNKTIIDDTKRKSNTDS